MKTAVREHSMNNTIIQNLCRFSVVGRHKLSLCTCVFEQAFFCKFSNIQCPCACIIQCSLL